jgi:arylformamidase
MTTLFSALDWRAMSQEARDLGLNNGIAVPGSVEMVAGWEQRSAAMRKRFPGHLDLRYGPRERNRIDFFKASEQAPTLLFIHGGYWQARAKEVFTVFAEGPMAHGINVAMIGYTLAPEVTLDEIVAEIHAGIDFLVAKLPALGVAAEGIVVSGWSAGGHLTAMALSHPRVRAGIAISGIYDLEPVRLNYLNDKLRLDEAEAARNSPLRHLPSHAAPLVVSVGLGELPELIRQSEEYWAAWHAQGLRGQYLPLPGHDHFSILEELARPSGRLFTALKDLEKTA